MTIIKADLALLDLHRGLWEGGLHSGKKSLVEVQLQGLSVEEKEKVALVVLVSLHAHVSFRAYRARSSQKATALAAATLRESTPWAMGMHTV